MEIYSKIKQLPKASGCYIFKNKFGEVIYVGKSKCLKNRVGQYFQNSDKKEGKIKNLVREIYDFDYIITETETDALLLECYLIKTKKPKYNSDLKRDKEYPCINIPLKTDYPSIYISTEYNLKDTETFGSFYSENDARYTIELINSIWKTPLCNKTSFQNLKQKRPCLNYSIGKCMAPCLKIPDQEDYKEKIFEIIGFLKGKNKKVISELNKEMKEQSAQLEFEKAAVTRDKIEWLKKLQNRSKKFNTNLELKEFCVFLRAYNEKTITLFYIKNGITLIKETYMHLEDISQNEFDIFANSIFTENFNVNNGLDLSVCVTAIHADKLYIDIKGKKLKTISTLLYNNYLEYFG